MANFNEQVIAEFHANAGKVGGPFDGQDVLLLHHVGAKSGISRVNPLVYMPDDDRYVIIASKNGAPQNPAWFHNLKANPEVKIEVGADVINVIASEATGDERDRLYARQAEAMPQFGDYEAKTTRRIPVIVLTPKA